LPESESGNRKKVIQELVDRFASNQSEYESSGYLESQLRTDFIDELFKALDWDLVNKNRLSRLQREVLVEKGDTKGRPDYSFRINGEDRFFVEAKAPSRGTDKSEDIFQAKRYGWNTRKVNIVVLTDFKSFRVFDTSLKPDLKQPKLGLVFELEFAKFGTTDFEKLWLLSKEKVASGSLDQLSSKDPSAKRLRIPVDTAFLEQMTSWREELAKDVYRHNSEITVRALNDVVQRLLDRLIFIRLLEDRKIIESKTLKEIVDNWKDGRHRDIQAQLNSLFKQLNHDFNGEIFKEHSCEKISYDSKIIAEIIDDLYYPKSPYDFAVIGVELLGTIYEKYLGKTIRLTEQRVKVEEKPEVRKAGGVYYTPKWVVSYIVENAVGKLVEAKKPKEIENLHVLDPACGSGSFLIEALDRLIQYHLTYYLANPVEARRSELFPNLVVTYDEDGNEIPRLSIYKKGEILKNNIYGVDLDPQAVEITMMSLYIKILEGERALPHNKELLPSLSNNIRCGNSLIGYDFFQQKTLTEDSDREKMNAFEWNSRATGFGKIMRVNKGFDAIIGNPPYVRSILLRDEPKTWEYYRTHYKTAFKEFDIYLCFLEKAYSLLAPYGRLGFIMPNKWLHAEMGEAARRFFKENRAIESIINFRSFQVFNEVTTYTMLIFLRNKQNEAIQVFNYTGSADARNITLDFNDKNYWQRGSFNYESLTEAPWNLVTGEAQQILEKLKSLPKFGEYFSLASGTGTRADPVFFVQKISETKDYYRVFSKQTQKEYDIEKVFVKPSAKGKDIDSYEIKNDSQLLVFPYQGRYLVDKKEIQTSSPNLWKYLEECREPLEKRENGRWKGNSYYCYGRPQNHDMLALKKILVPVIVNRAKAAWDSVGLYVIDSVYFVKREKQSDIADEYILALLNSNLLTYFLMKTSSNLRGGYFSMKPAYVDRFPLKATFSTKEEKEIYEQIIQTVTRINTISNTKSDIVTREVLTLRETIDDLICRLYGLTDEERRIVDGFGAPL
jgi:type I restriction-modification system DNA methylase subunit